MKESYRFNRNKTIFMKSKRVYQNKAHAVPIVIQNQDTANVQDVEGGKLTTKKLQKFISLKL